MIEYGTSLLLHKPPEMQTCSHVEYLDVVEYGFCDGGRHYTASGRCLDLSQAFRSAFDLSQHLHQNHPHQCHRFHQQIHAVDIRAYDTLSRRLQGHHSVQSTKRDW